MSQLQLRDDSAQRHDLNTSGEDFAKGSGYLLWTLLAAFLLVTAGVAAFLLTHQKNEVAAGEVTQVWAHPVRTLSSSPEVKGMTAAADTGGETFDQVLVFAQVRIRNQSDQPIVLDDMTSNITLEDGIHSSYAAGPIDYDRIFLAYPELAGLRSKTLVRNSVIQPSQVLEGMIVSSFHLSPTDWAARKDMNFALSFKQHPGLVLVPKTALIEQ